MKRIDWLRVSALAYGSASLIHHLHNALYLDDYPSMPASLSVATVGLAWFLTALVGLVGYALVRGGCEVAGLLVLAVFAALGLLGLGHYHLAPMAAHTLAMNATIATEVATACLLLAVVARKLLDRAIAP